MLEQHICSFMDGRVRLRHPALKNADTAQQIHCLLSAIAGVTSVTVNERTGSLLLYYDPQQLTRDTLLDMLRQGEMWLGITDTASPCSVARVYGSAGLRRWGYRVTLASLVLSVGLAMRGNTRAHILTGGAFLLLNAGHVWKARRAL